MSIKYTAMTIIIGSPSQAFSKIKSMATANNTILGNSNIPMLNLDLNRFIVTNVCNTRNKKH